MSFPLQAKPKQVKCKGTYTYTYSKSISLQEGEAKAVEHAIVMALADAFGTTVSSRSLMEMGNDYNRFAQLSLLEVKGRLVRHIDEPEVSAPEFRDNLVSVTVKVAFYAQPIETAPTEFTVRPLRNGTEDTFEAYHYVADDRFYLSFETPKEGYVAVFFDDGNNAQCMLPYVGDDDTPFHVEKGKRHVFFTDAYDTYRLTCGAEPEVNYLHVLFSPAPFIDGDLVREMSSRKMQEWLGRRRDFDPKMEVQSIMIRVTPKEI